MHTTTEGAAVNIKSGWAIRVALLATLGLSLGCSPKGDEGAKESGAPGAAVEKAEEAAPASSLPPGLAKVASKGGADPKVIIIESSEFQ